MKDAMLWLLASALLVACQQNSTADFKGNWKTDKVYYFGKDMSRSSDPTKENGIWFDGQNNYRRFGNPAYQQEGTYRLQGEWLVFEPKEDSLATFALYEFKKDSLYLQFPYPKGDTLKMSFYRMEDK